MRALAQAAACAALSGALAVAQPVLAQQTAAPGLQTGQEAIAAPNLRAPVVTLDRERLYLESLPGQAAQARFERESAALIAENRSLEAALEEEERSLTERRAQLPPEEFRELAAAFDAKVESLRQAQDAKSRALARQRDDDRQAFFEAAVPVLGQLMVDLNAAAIIDRSAIILTFDQFDITDLAIARLNAQAEAQMQDQIQGQTDPQAPAETPSDAPEEVSGEGGPGKGGAGEGSQP